MLNYEDIQKNLILNSDDARKAFIINRTLYHIPVDHEDKQTINKLIEIVKENEELKTKDLILKCCLALNYKEFYESKEDLKRALKELDYYI